MNINRKLSSFYNSQKVKADIRLKRSPAVEFRSATKNPSSLVEVDIVNTENRILHIMMEDETLWINSFVKESELSVDNFFEELKDGVLLCRLGNAIECFINNQSTSTSIVGSIDDSDRQSYAKKCIKFAKPQKSSSEINKFMFRDNTHNFLQWCRSHDVPSTVLFESNDCVEPDAEGKRTLVTGIMNIARFFYHKCRIPPPAMVQAEEDLHTNDSSLGGESLALDSAENITHETRPTQTGNNFSKIKPISQELQTIVDDFDLSNHEVVITDEKIYIYGKYFLIRKINQHLLVRVGGGWEPIDVFIRKQFCRKSEFNKKSRSDSVTFDEVFHPNVEKTTETAYEQQSNSSVSAKVESSRDDGVDNYESFKAAILETAMKSQNDFLSHKKELRQNVERFSFESSKYDTKCPIKFVDEKIKTKPSPSIKRANSIFVSNRCETKDSNFLFKTLGKIECHLAIANFINITGPFPKTFSKFKKINTSECHVVFDPNLPSQASYISQGNNNTTTTEMVKSASELLTRTQSTIISAKKQSYRPHKWQENTTVFKSSADKQEGSPNIARNPIFRHLSMQLEDNKMGKSTFLREPMKKKLQVPSKLKSFVTKATKTETTTGERGYRPLPLPTELNGLKQWIIHIRQLKRDCRSSRPSLLNLNRFSRTSNLTCQNSTMNESQAPVRKK